MTLYMIVSRDKYELPMAVADSISELAVITGMNVKTLRSSFSRLKSGAYKTSGYVIIDVEEE